MDKETKRVVKSACKRGWELTHNKGHHFLIHPTGRKVTVSASPSCIHAYKNVERDLLKIEKEFPIRVAS